MNRFRKTKAQIHALRSNKMLPFLWQIIAQYQNGDLLAMNWLTGTFRYIGK